MPTSLIVHFAPHTILGPNLILKYPLLRGPEWAPFRLELLRRLIAQRSVRTVLVVIGPLHFDLDLRILLRGESALVQAFLPELTVEALYAFVFDGLTGADNVQFHSVAMSHSSTARDVNSVPLSVVMTRGDACVFARRSSTVTTRFPVIEDHTSMAGLTRLK